MSDPQDQTSTVAHWKQAARESFAEGDLTNTREHLTRMLALYRDQRGNDLYEWCRNLAEVAHEYLRVGELKPALAILGEATDLNLPAGDEGDDGLGTAAAGLHRRLAVRGSGSVRAAIALPYFAISRSRAIPSFRAK